MARRSGLRKVNRLRRLLRRLPDDATEQIERVIAYGALSIQADAKQGAPIEEGTLREGIKIRKSRDGLTARIGYVQKRDQRKAFYAIFVHWGTRFKAGNPYLLNAFNRNRRAIADRADRAITRALEIASRGAGNSD